MRVDTINKVANALEVIRDVCKNTCICENCIFYNKDYDTDASDTICMLSKSSPNAWRICDDI